MRTSAERALRGLLWDKVPRDHRQDPRPFLVRRIVTGVFLVIGAAVLGWSLQIEPGDSTFIVATLVLAAVWTIGAFASGPLYLGRVARAGVHDDLRRPVAGAVVLGLALAGVFVVGALVVRQVPVIDRQISSVLDHADQGVTPLLVLITVVNGIAEELFFRGALYAASPRYPVVGQHGRLRDRDPRHRKLHARVRGRAARRRGGPRAAGLRRDPRTGADPRHLVDGDAVPAAAAVLSRLRAAGRDRRRGPAGRR